MKAAVLVPLDLRGEDPHVILTRRDAGLSAHAGEICFPGGRHDPGDATLLDTALREAEEEIGLRHDGVRVLGALSPTQTFVTNYLIHPFVGALLPDPHPGAVQSAWKLSPAEVASVLALPLRALRKSRTRTSLTRRGFTFETDAYLLDGHLIWGATARIIDDLLARLHTF